MGTIGKRIHGWEVGSAFGDGAFYKGDGLLRAAAAHVGIFGNSAEEDVYPMIGVLPDGEPIDTRKHHYTLTVKDDQLPPAPSGR